ncbi:arsenite efflux membrane protein ArsB (TC 3.A.4.1.1 TC 2.A.45.1.1) [Paenibacillus sp. 1_12]|uniref:ArsB/NhaD family transporter n=1 Tax=Paenibacillus sp. 1_12 TaxID=1566278 RepID=UPI0008E039E6|nr:ArsB/NhaD family transporter [Paenibacillus sp. 1_12]SFM40326.1 arsenite efflux membrane protein ArsB (TC 3.A.4.1.1 TC 2.A.45.1.1) [Paenibacillus sp. 1_12]
MLQDFMIPITILSFLCTITFIFLHPNVNESIPATIGAIFVLLSGSVTLSDLGKITETIGGAAVTIMATIVMAIVLESFGFFNWSAEKLLERARGSGIRLFWYTNLFCFLMTLFVNNDGSILITTPILLMLLHKLGLKNHHKIPYLLSGALIATASSAPIGVSNIVNLIALKIVHMDLYMHTAMMFVPASLGLVLLTLLLFISFYRVLPRKLSTINAESLNQTHPLKEISSPIPKENQTKFMRNILIFVFSVRVSLFVASFIHFPVPLMAVIGSAFLLGWRWYYLRITPADMITKTPWYILIFAFSMYVIIYGLHNIGLTQMLIHLMQPLISGNLLHASVMMGILLSILSNLFNNHPALMVGTLTLTNMGLDPLTLKISYLASVIGSDIGSLLLPIGTLATLMWMHIIKKGKVKLSWVQYLKVTSTVIPITVIFTLVILAFWVSWFF